MGNVETLVAERRSGVDRRASERVFHQAAKNLVEAMKMTSMAEGVERVASRDLRYAHESLDAASLPGT